MAIWLVRAEDRGLGRIVQTTIGLVLAQLAVMGATFALGLGERSAGVLELVPLAAVAVLSWLTVRWMCRLGAGRALVASLPTLISGLPAALLSLFVLRPYVAEPYLVASNSMAPTLLSRHWTGVCPVCGRPNYCAPVDPRAVLEGWGYPPLMICDQFHTAETTVLDDRVRPADRAYAAKYLEPRRWDLVVFGSPNSPDTRHILRVVGLPGETVWVEDGAVWINGQEANPPTSLQRIQYLDKMPDLASQPLWGAASRPAQLGSDEYFVLGDFSARARDPTRYPGPTSSGWSPTAIGRPSAGESFADRPAVADRRPHALRDPKPERSGTQPISGQVGWLRRSI